MAPPHQSPFEPDSSISAFHSQFPMKNRVLTENCLKKRDDGDHRLGYAGNPNQNGVVSQMDGTNLMSESLNYDMTNSSSPHGVPIMGAVSKGVSDFSQTSGFHIEGLSPSKMAKVCEVLSSLDIKVYSRRKNRIAIGN